MTTDFIKINMNHEGNLVIEKASPVKYGEIFLYFLIPAILIIGPPVYYFSTTGFNVKFEWLPAIILLSMMATGVWISWITIRRSLRMNRTIVLSTRQGNIYINDSYFCKTAELEPVVLQTLPAAEKEKHFYNIGIASGRKFAPLLFSKDGIKAHAAKTLLSKFFAGEIRKEEGQTISVLK